MSIQPDTPADTNALMIIIWCIASILPNIAHQGEYVLRVIMETASTISFLLLIIINIPKAFDVFKSKIKKTRKK